MSHDPDRLYRLLPSVLRQHDHVQGQPLRALMAVFESELRTLELETETTWDDWFIETCSEWLVPYIGEAVGVRGLRSVTATAFSARAFVANVLLSRQRKGTISVLEQLARDLTGHGSAAVEYFQRLIVTPHLSHVRQLGISPSTLGTLSLRDPGPLQWLGRPFGTDVRTPDVRHIDRRARTQDRDRGLWNLPNIGLHMWTLQSRSIVRSEARGIVGEPEWYRCDPFGRDLPLFSIPYPEQDISSMAGPEHMARALSRLELSQEERGLVPERWLGPNAVVRVRAIAADGTERLFSTEGDLVLDNDADGQPDTALPLVVVGSESLPRLRIAHLADLGGGALPTRRPPDAQIVYVDPENGRIVFHPDAVDPEPAAVLVDYVVGHASDVGAGPWDRTGSLASQLAAHDWSLDEVTAQWGVSVTEANGAEVFGTLGEALDAWNTFVGASSEPANETGVIVMMDSRAYTRDNAAAVAVTIELPTGSRLLIVAGNWPIEVVSGIPTRVAGHLDASRLRPSIADRLLVQSDPTALGIATRAGGLWLNGLAIEEGVTVLAGALERLSVAHCTTRSPAFGVRVQVAGPGTSNTALAIDAVRCLLGPVIADGPIAEARFEASVVHGDPVAVQLVGAQCTVGNCTVLGTLECRELNASDCIFSGRLDIMHTQRGCVRFSYVPQGSVTPRRYRCQPDLALNNVADDLARARVLARTRPVWTTLDPAHPAYAQLAQACPDGIIRGAEDGLEMGVFFHRQLPWREDNLRFALRQFLRHGLEAGLRYEN